MVAKDQIVLEWAVTEILEEKIANSYQIQLFERLDMGKWLKKPPIQCIRSLQKLFLWNKEKRVKQTKEAVNKFRCRSCYGQTTQKKNPH